MLNNIFCAAHNYCLQTCPFSGSGSKRKGLMADWTIRYENEGIHLICQELANQFRAILFTIGTV